MPASSAFLVLCSMQKSVAVELIVPSCGSCSSRTILTIVKPVMSWRQRVTGRAVVTAIRRDSKAACWWWKTRQDLRLCMLMCKGRTGCVKLAIRADASAVSMRCVGRKGRVAPEAYKGAGPGRSVI